MGKWKVDVFGTGDYPYIHLIMDGVNVCISEIHSLDQAVMIAKTIADRHNWEIENSNG